jgi:hypothetical protein
MAAMSLARLRARFSPEVLFVLAVTAWGIAFLPFMWQELLKAIDLRYSSDFDIFAGASRLAWSGGDPYSVDTCLGCAYRYSPLFAYLFAPVAALGVTFWTGLHLAAIFALPFRIARIVPFLWPFWWDVGVGSNLFFVAVLGYWAMRGKGWAIVAILVVALLIPRPLMVPIVVWLLWHHREARFPFAVLGVGTLAFAYGTGHLSRWMEILTSSGSELGVPYNVGPSQIIGLAWVPIGLAIAAWLTWKGRVGWAGLAISPYWLPYYLMMPIIDLQPTRRPEVASNHEAEVANANPVAAMSMDALEARGRAPAPSTDQSTH